ncbi:Subtilin transport ATP-binding protein SpaT [Cucumispora dikerogammari]|nr:Subtilin transport ATP-binding protein SpaT [Cucumispora dikerogammari]
MLDKQKTAYSIRADKLFGIIIRYFIQFKSLFPIYVILGALTMLKSVLEQKLCEQLGKIANLVTQESKNEALNVTSECFCCCILSAVINCTVYMFQNRISTDAYINMSIKQITNILGKERIVYLNQTPEDYVFNLDRCSKGISSFMQYIITSYLGSITTVVVAFKAFIKYFGVKNSFYFILAVSFHLIINYMFIHHMIQYRYSENKSINFVRRSVIEKLKNRDLIVMSGVRKQTINTLEKQYKEYGNQHVKTESITPVMSFILYSSFYIGGLSFIFHKINSSESLYYSRVEVFVTGFLSLKSLYNSLNYLGYIYQFTYLTSANITMGYSQINKPVVSTKSIYKIFFITLQNYSGTQLKFNLHFNNEKILITGSNGAGKTFFVESLLGFHHKQVYQSVNGVSFQFIDQKSFYSNISYCSSDFKLFSGTIIENILFGSTKTQEEIQSLCLRLGVLKHFSDLTQNFNKDLGDNFENISSGEKQIICIVRALSKEADIYIFDEPTNYLETPVRESFLNYINIYLRHKTIIVISQDKWILDNIQSNKILHIENRAIEMLEK